MTFHLAPEFPDAVQAAAAHFKLRPIFIEKDYWVTFVLKNLSSSNHINDVVFKGGTSLSKAYNCIERFSEDIDLAILKDETLSGNQLTNKIKSVEKRASQGLEYFQHPNEEKKGRNRRTFYQYPKALIDSDFGQIKDHIQLEINTFTNPVPYQDMQISSYVAQFLRQDGFNQFVEKHNLREFPVKVLTRERTFFEKLFSLIRLSHEGPEKLKEKIRHFYDLHKLLNSSDLREKILIDVSFELIDLVKRDDASNAIFTGNWITQPLSASPLLLDVDLTWKAIDKTYHTELSQLIWSENLPPSAEIISSLKQIKEFLQRYDKG
jgi:predicted nucleotidyltransferase component of viral defense system